MGSIRPQFYPNTLQPLEVNIPNLQNVLRELQSAVKNGVNMIQTGYQLPEDHSGYGNIYSGTPGIVLTLLRLHRQRPSIWQLTPNDDPRQDYLQIAQDLIVQTSVDIELIDGRLSPIASNLAPSFIRILHYCEHLNSGSKIDATAPIEDLRLFNQAIERATLHGPVNSFQGHSLGGDELIFGRAGLLWSILTLQRHASLTTLSTEELLLKHLQSALQSVPKLVDAIIAGGKHGASEYAKLYGTKHALPLMWQWMEGYYSHGAAHGQTGILSILLACELSEEQQQEIAATVTGLCRICIENRGHLPMSVPDRPETPERTSPLVQLCHGPPGLLILLSVVYGNTSFVDRFWRPEWDQALYLATEKVWEEGLLSKGGNLCHGLSGNAWALLSMYNVYDDYGDVLQQAKNKRMAELERSGSARVSGNPEDVLSADYFLSRALPFMSLALESPPYSDTMKIKPRFDFRAPDRPYSLGEGLAGEICAWAETCAIINACLKKMGVDVEAVEDNRTDMARRSSQLGFVIMVVNGPTGRK